MYTLIIMQISVQIGLNLTGLELSLAKVAKKTYYRYKQTVTIVEYNTRINPNTYTAQPQLVLGFSLFMRKSQEDMYLPEIY